MARSLARQEFSSKAERRMISILRQQNNPATAIRRVDREIIRWLRLNR
jgi:hypothetical protein